MSVLTKVQFAGCNLAVDVTWKYLNFFLSDDAELKHIEAEYGSGRMLTGEAKAQLIKVGSCTATHTVVCCTFRHAQHAVCIVDMLSMLLIRCMLHVSPIRF